MQRNNANAFFADHATDGNFGGSGVAAPPYVFAFDYNTYLESNQIEDSIAVANLFIMHSAFHTISPTFTSNAIPNIAGIAPANLNVPFFSVSIARATIDAPLLARMRYSDEIITFIIAYVTANTTVTPVRLPIFSDTVILPGTQDTALNSTAIAIATSFMQVDFYMKESINMCILFKSKLLKKENIKQRFQQCQYNLPVKPYIDLCTAYFPFLKIDRTDANFKTYRDSDAFLKYHTTGVSTPSVLKKFIEDLGSDSFAFISATAQAEIIAADEANYDARAADKINKKHIMMAVAYHDATGTMLDDWYQGEKAVGASNAEEYSSYVKLFKAIIAQKKNAVNLADIKNPKMASLAAAMRTATSAVARDEAVEEYHKYAKLVFASEEMGLDIKNGEILNDTDYGDYLVAKNVEKEIKKAEMRGKIDAAKRNIDKKYRRAGMGYTEMLVEDFLSIFTSIASTLVKNWKGTVLLALIVFVASLFFFATFVKLIGAFEKSITGGNKILNIFQAAGFGDTLPPGTDNL
jgi:hypothetical protein